MKSQRIRLISRVFSLLFVLLLIVPCFAPKPKADALADVIKTVSGIGATGAVVVSAPAVLALATVAVLGGLVYENYDQISANMIDFYSYCETRDYNIQQEILANETKVQISKSGIDMYRQYLSYRMTNSQGISIGKEVNNYVLLKDTFLVLKEHYFTISSYPYSITLFRQDQFNKLSTGLYCYQPIGGLFNLYPDSLWDTTNRPPMFDWYGDTYQLFFTKDATNVYIKNSNQEILKTIPISSFPVGRENAFYFQFNRQGTTNLTENILGAVYEMYDTTATNVIGNRTAVNSNVTSQNATKTFDSGLEVTYPSATTIPQSTVIGQTATTVTQNPATTITNTAVTTTTGTAYVEPTQQIQKFTTPQLITTKFPFSIPFDVVRAFQMVAADPEVPSWSMDIPIPQTGTSYHFEFGFQDFDFLAKLCRFFCTAIFILLLIVATNKLLGRN